MSLNRLFLAFDVPESSHRALQLVQRHLPKAGARWTFTRHFHLTLKFLGEVDLVKQVQVQCLVRDLVKSMTFSKEDLELGWTKVGVFHKGEDPSVVWAGVGMSPALYQFQYELDSALAGLGFEIEKRTFRPHVTLARLRSLESYRRREVRAALESLGLQRGRFSVSGVTLYRTLMREDAAPEYEALDVYPFV